MKILLFLLALLCTVSFSYAQQNTNPWPATGPIGIGTANPDVLLHVFEPADSRPNGTVSPSKAILKLSRSGTPYYSYTESAEFRIAHSGPNVWGSQLDLYVNGGSNQNNVPDQHAMSWLYNGNVGIGTITPDEKLVVNGAIKTVLDGAFPAKNMVKITPLGYSGITGAQNWAIRGVYQYVNGVGGNADGGDLDIIKSMNGITVLATKYDGSSLGGVAIGTTDTHGFKLAVNGNIRAQEIKVEASPWPDFVFTPTYGLATLNEVKSYIDQNHHLPEVPSAQQIAKEGLNLGEMNVTLLKKVEELTLYLIEKDKQVNDQNIRLAAQQKEIEQLKQQQEKTAQQDVRIVTLEKALLKLTKADKQ